MGMYDVFVATEVVTCPEGHLLGTEWQTKELGCVLAYYRVGDPVPGGHPLLRRPLGIEIIEGRVLVYEWDKACEKMYVRWATIEKGRFAGLGPVEAEERDEDGSTEQ